MDFALTPAQSDLRDRARRFVETMLQPREVEFQRAGGRMPREWGSDIRRAAVAANLHGGSLPRERDPTQVRRPDRRLRG